MIPARPHAAFEAGFLVYLRALMARRFHAVRLAGAEGAEHWDARIPTIAYANHSGWWDGFMGLLTTNQALHGRFFVMMEERHLARYRFFTRLGAFGVNREHPREAMRSLAHATELLQAERSVLWIFPQGVLRPNDVRPLAFQSGASRLGLRALSTHGAVRLLPVALRYEFLHEDRPEALIRLGDPELLTTPCPPRQLSARMEATLTSLLDDLHAEVANADLGGYLPLIEGGMSLNKRLDALKVRLGLLPREAFTPRNGA